VFGLLLLTATSSPAGGQAMQESSGLPAQFTASGAATDGEETTPGPRRRPFVTALFAVPILTFVGPLGPLGSEVLLPADRFGITQIIGAGYVLNPRVRLGVIGIFNEALTGLPPGASPWQFGGAAPVIIGTRGRFIIGGGPIISYRSGGKRRFDSGAVVLTGASFPLGSGLALNIITPVAAVAAARTTVSVGIGVGVGKVF
jgi:hypothetical protein